MLVRIADDTFLEYVVDLQEKNKSKKGKKQEEPNVPLTSASPEEVEAVVVKITAQGETVRALKSRKAPKVSFF